MIGNKDKKPDIHAFEAAATDVNSANNKLIFIEQTNNKLIELVPELNDRQVKTLLAALHTAGKLKKDDDEDGNGQFDAANEVAMLLKTVKALREQVMLNGDIKQGVSIGEAQKVVTACGGMINTLMKHHEKIKSADRQRAIEGAVIDIMQWIEQTYPDVKGVVDSFMQNLEKRLAAIE